MDEVTYISIPGLVLLILRYYHHCFGCLRQQLFEINTSNLREYVESSLSSSVLGPVTEFHSMISSTGTFIFDKVDAEKAFWSISTIVESNLMPCASYSLMGFSLFCAYLVMRNVSSSYPEVPEVTDRRTTDNFTTYDFHGNGKSPAVHSRGDGPARGDFKSFVNVKTRDSKSPVPQLGSLRKGSDRSTQISKNSRYSGNIPTSSPSPGPFDYYMESEEHSMISDDGASEFSRNENRPYDTNEESLMRESVTNPSTLIGWQITIKGRGVGLILDMKKSLGRTTKYKVQFEDGTIKLLSLKRSEKKGNIPFSLITKAN